MLEQIKSFLAGLAALHPKPLEGDVDGVPIILRNSAGAQEIKVVDLEPYGVRPRARKASPRFRDVDSFAAYHALHRVADETIVIFDPNILRCVAYFDHLPAAGSSEPRAGSWFRHTATLDIASTVEWLRWRKATTSPLNQVDFAELIDDLSYTISEPDAAKLLEVVQNLSETRTAQFGSKVSLRDGTVSFVYTESGAATEQTIKVPEQLQIGLHITETSPEPVSLTVKIRYRWGADKRPVFHLAIPGLDLVLRQEAERLRNSLSNALGDDVVFLGFLQG